MELYVLLLALFVLSLFLGVELITKIPPTLHTPLMSGSNAISGITIVGALVALFAAALLTVLPASSSFARTQSIGKVMV